MKTHAHSLLTIVKQAPGYRPAYVICKGLTAIGEADEHADAVAFVEGAIDHAELRRRTVEKMRQP